MEVDDALEMFWEQEAANNPIPQFSESDLSEVGDDETTGMMRSNRAKRTTPLLLTKVLGRREVTVAAM